MASVARAEGEEPPPETRKDNRPPWPEYETVEVRVLKRHADLIRKVAKTFCNPGNAAVARRKVLDAIVPPPSEGFKEWLASAPLDGIDLSRSRKCDSELRADLDSGRDAER